MRGVLDVLQGLGDFTGSLFEPRIRVYAFPELRNVITAPTIAAALPPNNNQRVLLVGAPVKVRDTSELAESDALKPKTINATPTTNSAMPIPLFIIFLSSSD